MYLPRKSVLLIAIPFIIVACGDKKADKANEVGESKTQAVATVNSEEISIHQVNYLLGRIGNQSPLTEAQTKQASEQILARLVDQQLLRQKALEAKLDRDPRVLQVIESTKDELLAQAYLEQVLSKATKPSADQIKTFYKENPDLFEKRRVFRLQELTLDVDKSKFSEIEEAIKGLKGINDIATWLASKNYAFSANSNVRAAEQLPTPLLKKLQLLNDGEFVVMSNGQSLNIVHIAASQLVPVSLDKATPIIEQYFLNKNKANLAKNEMTSMREKAKIQFIGSFESMNKSYTAGALIEKNDEKTPTKPEPIDSSKSLLEKPAQPIADGVNLDKGLSGL